MRIQNASGRILELDERSISVIEQLTAKSIFEIIADANKRNLRHGQLTEYELNELVAGKDILEWHIIEDSIAYHHGDNLWSNNK
jgi:hypothetical protein